MIMEDGYTKYQVRHHLGPAPEHAGLPTLEALRTWLFEVGGVGITEQGIGYGNVSLRRDKSSFIVSATSTGGIRKLGAQGYSLVTHWDIRANTLDCYGVKPASSEALTHGAVYEASPTVGCVVHIHSVDFFKKYLKQNVPATIPGALYGTTAMAESVAELVCKCPQAGSLVMTGHQDGILFYGPGVSEVETLLRKTYKSGQQRPAVEGD